MWSGEWMRRLRRERGARECEEFVQERALIIEARWSAGVRRSRPWRELYGEPEG
jgi:hypothetical protein